MQRLCLVLAALLLTGCTGWEKPPVTEAWPNRPAIVADHPPATEPSAQSGPKQTAQLTSPDFDPSLTATIPGRLDLPPSERTNPSGTKTLTLAPIEWSSSPAPTTATIPFYTRGEHTSYGYLRGSYLRQGEYTRGEQTVAGYVPGNYRGESDDYVRGEHTSRGYIRGNYRSEPLFTTPTSPNIVQPSTGSVAQWRP